MAQNEEDLICPACGSDELSYGESRPPRRGIVECHAEGCEVVCIAGSVTAALAIWCAGEWTHELVDRDENGKPTYTPKEPKV
jgi:hypothetical protein